MASSASFTTEFKDEIEFELGRWLRKRFVWYSAFTLFLHAVRTIGTAVLLFVIPSAMPVAAHSSSWFTFGIGAVAISLHVAALVYVMHRRLGREPILRVVFWLIVVIGAMNLILTPISASMQMANIDKIVDDAIARKLKEKREKAAAESPPESTDAEEGDAPPEPDAPAEPDSIRVELTNIVPNSNVGFEVQTDDKSGLSPEKYAEARRVGENAARVTMTLAGLGMILGPHFFACLFLPWTPRESVRPLVPLYILHVLITLGFYSWNSPLWAVAVAILAGPVLALPGLGICWWRQGRFKDRFTTKLVKTRYTELKQELTSARQIHESLFPRPIHEGDIRLDYRYEPMRQIGGDYLYARSSPDSLTIAIIDVTGHGISAALAVNRLHGEIDRQFGENPDVRPGDLLVGLNSYLHYALAAHSVYATAICIRVDLRNNTLAWASAGHPPAFIRAVDGTIDRLDSTTLVLGACRGDDFQSAERTTRFGPGDVLIAYTDGATEARNQHGKMLAVAGFERLIACVQPHTCTNTGDWCAGVLQMVDSYRFGPVQDDTLIVEISRPL